MDANKWIALLGLTLEEKRVQAFLRDLGFKKTKPKMEDYRGSLENEKSGIIVHFTDESFLDVPTKKYPEGAIVLSGITLIGPGNKFYKHPFKGQLPYGVSLEMDRKKAMEIMKKKPSLETPDKRIARWDLKDHCMFLDFDKTKKQVSGAAIQLPVK